MAAVVVVWNNEAILAAATVSYARPSARLMAKRDAIAGTCATGHLEVLHEQPKHGGSAIMWHRAIWPGIISHPLPLSPPGPQG